MNACLFQLAGILGTTVSDLRNRMTGPELIEWCRWLRHK